MNRLGMLVGGLIFGVSFFFEFGKKKKAAAPTPSPAPEKKKEGFQPAGDSPEKVIAELEKETVPKV